jgi:hypothetical protein
MEIKIINQINIKITYDSSTTIYNQTTINWIFKLP